MKRLFTSVVETALAALLAWPGSLQAEPIDIGGHLVTFRGVEYDYPEPGESTWFYTVVSDGPPAISHVVFGLACDVIQILDAGTWDGADFASLNSGGGHPEPNHFPSAPIWDPTTLVTGMKFNGGFDEGETRHYYFTVNGNYEVDEIAVFAIKAGQLVLTGFVPGPSSDCEEVGPPPTASIALTKTGETIYETVQDCDVFGLAKAFNALIFGNFTAIGGDTEEPLAVGGTAWLTSGYSVGFALFGNPIPTHYGSAVDMLIVGGDLHDGSFGVNGNIVYGGTRYGPTRIMANGNVLRHVNPVTFDDAGNVPDDGSGVTFAELLARLTERGLQLAALADRGRLALPDADAAAEQQEVAERALAAAGLARYEISNYAAPGFESRHNLVYWRRGDYLGLGCAAHSMMNGTRFFNTSSLDEYLAGSRRASSRALTADEARGEELMLRLRLAEGIDLADFLRGYGVDLWAEKGDVIAGLVDGGLARLEDGRLALTSRGLNLQSAVLMRLM